jgi:hypothetical protein
MIRFLQRVHTKKIHGIYCARRTEERGCARTPLGYWRVKIAWPKHHPEREVPARYFGRFKSQAEAERWIKEHEWMKQRPESESPPQATEPD